MCCKQDILLTHKENNVLGEAIGLLILLAHVSLHSDTALPLLFCREQYQTLENPDVTSDGPDSFGEFVNNK